MFRQYYKGGLSTVVCTSCLYFVFLFNAVGLVLNPPPAPSASCLMSHISHPTFKVSRDFLGYFDKHTERIYIYRKSIKKVLSKSGYQYLFHQAFRVINKRRYEFFKGDNIVHVSHLCHLLSYIKDIRFIHVY